MSNTYVPIIKNKGFNPKPVAGNIPIFADSVSNPKCIGTSLWEEWWLEQFYYLENGYTTGGIWIPPFYYYHLNFNIIKGLHGSVYPDFIDVHYELFKEIHEVKKYREPGLVIPKARRKGLSIVGNVLGSWGYRFIPDYRMGVAAGLEKYVKGFRQKLYSSFNNVPPELKLNWIRRNDDTLEIGYEFENSQGSYEPLISSITQFATMSDHATKFEGEFFHDVIMEETGQFAKADQAYESIRPALELGEETLGTFYFYGTGGNVLTGSKAFKELWYHAESYGLRRFFIGGQRYFFPYYGGAKHPDGAKAEKLPNIKEQYPDASPEQLIGVEDVKAAKEKILEGRIIRAKNPNKKALIEWNQKYPLTVEEVFTSSGSNNFDNDLLYGQNQRIDSEPPRYKEYVLEWVKDEMGDIEIPRKVTIRPARKKDPEWRRIEVLDGGLPKPEYRHLDTLGIDSYNEDQTTTSDSLGSCVVLRDLRHVDFDSEYFGIVPIVHYMKRPPRKEQFYEIALMIAIAWNTVKDAMLSAEYDLIIDYFKKNEGKRYLSPRPKSFDSPDTKQSHDYGVKMNMFSKPRMMGILQTWVVDFISQCWFGEIINNFIAYDEENIGTDWDNVDAIGYALMRIIDRSKKPRQNEQKRKSVSDLPYYQDVGGQIMDISDISMEELKEMEDVYKKFAGINEDMWDI